MDECYLAKLALTLLSLSLPAKGSRRAAIPCKSVVLAAHGCGLELRSVRIVAGIRIDRLRHITRDIPK
jgi:hypothetical protein